MSKQPRVLTSSSARIVAVGTGISLALAGLPFAAVGVPQPTLPGAATVDVLPTPQINGVVWDQSVAGDSVFAVGHFSSARPHGAPEGVGEQDRTHVMAYSLTSGRLLPFAPRMNGQVRTVETSKDGSIVFLGGDFTRVNGQARYRAAAFDTRTGELLDWFRPSFDYVIMDIEVTDTTVYFGGKFSTAGRTPRSNIAAYNLRSGRLTDWAPEVTGGQVMSIVAHPTGDAIALAGNFTKINGQPEPGWGAVTASDGANLPWEGNEHLQNSGPNAAMFSLAADDKQVFVSGYDYYGGSPFENVAAASWDGGRLNWVSGCRGDTYDVALAGDVIYSTGHPHNCETIGGLPEYAGKPRRYQRASAYTAAPSPTGRLNTLGAFSGWVAPEILAFTPDINIGSYTGQNQGPWTIETAGDYVLIGGEFTEVNGKAQQGLVRFAKRGIAPALIGPRGDLTVTGKSVDKATVTVGFNTVADRDDAQLEYELQRNGQPVATLEARSFWWTSHEQELVDDQAPTGRHDYTVAVRDRDGNELVSPPIRVEVTDGIVEAEPAEPVDPERAGRYATSVIDDGPVAYWRFNEAAGKFASAVGRRDLQTEERVERGVGDAFGATSAVNFGATEGFGAAETRKTWGLQTFTVEALIKTDSRRGGVIANFGDSKSGKSWGKDRFLSMTDAGHVQLGVFSDRARVLRTEESFNDGQWHHVAATVDPSGARLVVDGVERAFDERMDAALRFWGYWRVGNEDMGKWNGAPSSPAFDGAIDDVAIYSRALPVAQLAAHADAAGFAADGAAEPDRAAHDDSAAALDLAGTQARAQVDGAKDQDAPKDVVLNGEAWQALQEAANANDIANAAQTEGKKPHPQLVAAARDPLNITEVLDDPAAQVSNTGGKPTQALSPQPNVSPSAANSVAAAPVATERGTVAVADSLLSVDGDPTHRWAAREHDTLVISGDRGLVVAAGGNDSAVVLGRDIQVHDAVVNVTLPDGLTGVPVGAGVGAVLGADKSGYYRAVLRPRGVEVTELAIEKVAGSAVTVLRRSRVDVPAGAALDLAFEVAGEGKVLRASVLPHGGERVEWNVETQAPPGSAVRVGSAGMAVDAAGITSADGTHATFRNLVLTLR